MEEAVSAFQLRNAIHELITLKEGEINEIIAQHDEILRELYGMLVRRHGDSTDFPPMEGEELDDGAMSGYEQWKEAYRLQAGLSRIANLSLPPIPPLSPPTTATIFPDEAEFEAQAEVSKTLDGKSSIPNGNRVGSTMTVEPPHISPPRSRRAPSTPPRSPSLLTTASMRDIQPKRRKYSPTPNIDPPEWVPLENYRPASVPLPSPPGLSMSLETEYSTKLPLLPPVPPRQGKRHRKGSKAEDRNTDLFQLSLAFSLNPVSGSLAKSSKCVLTSDWKVAQQELRHIRAMERIEAKKKDGRWSLRQPKKLRGPTIPKAHWDYLLDEMEWMRTDFAEERRWKVVMAREFAYQAVEWHLSNTESKASRMVGGRGWGKCNDVPIPGHPGIRMDMDELPLRGSAEDVVEMLVGQADPEDGFTAEQDGAVGMDATGAEVLEDILPKSPGENADTAGPLEPIARRKGVDEDITMRGDALAGDGMPQSDDMGELDAAPELDAVGELDAIGAGDLDAEGEADVSEVGVVGLEDIQSAPVSAGMLDKEPETATPEPRKDQVLPNGLIINKRFANAEELMSARTPILDLPLSSGTIDVQQVAHLGGHFPLYADEDPQSPPLLSDLFPDLAVYGGPGPAEEDKLQNRLDEGHTSGHRIAHTSRLMDIRPVFVSILQPAKNAVDGSWDLHDGLWYEDPKGSADVAPEAMATTSSVFTGRKLKPANPKSVPQISVSLAQQLRPEHCWTDEDDTLLKCLVRTYPFNWQLIADSLGSQLIGHATDRPSAYECWDRWYWQFGEGKGKIRPDPDSDAATANAGPSDVPPSPAAAPAPHSATSGFNGNSISAIVNATGSTARAGQTPQQTPMTSTFDPTGPMTTDGDAGYEGQGPPPPGLSKREARQANKHKYEGSKKSVRHQVLYDSVRRLVRRRETTKQKTNFKDQPKRVIQVHESHSSYVMTQVGTPFELVEAKFQTDMRQRLDRQNRANQIQEARAQAARQQAMMNAQQFRPPGANRIGANGQAMPNMAASQQQLLTAVAAVTNAARQNAGVTNGMLNVHGRISQSAQGQAGQIPNAQVMQMLQAQQFAARQAQAQAQQQSQAHGRITSNGTPHSQPGNLSASPYSQPPGELPNGELAHGSPIMQNPAGAHSSPSQQAAAMQQQQAVAMGVVPSMPMVQGSQIRLQNGAGPQMNNAGQSMGNPAMHNAAMQQIMATLAASGQQATPETIRALQQQMLRNAQVQAQAAQSAIGDGNMSLGASQMAMQDSQGVPHFARSPSVQNSG